MFINDMTNHVKKALWDDCTQTKSQLICKHAFCGYL